MPGTPDYVLGTLAATYLVASTVGLLVVSIPFVLRDRLPGPRPLALSGGLVYALCCLGVWAGVRYAVDAFASSLFEQPLALVVLLLGSVVVLGAQAAIPLYLNARWSLLTPLAGLFVLTTLVLVAFLQVRGESDPLALYVLFFGPLLLGGVCILALLEIGFRRLLFTLGVGR